VGIIITGTKKVNKIKPSIIVLKIDLKASLPEVAAHVKRIEASRQVHL